MARLSCDHFPGNRLRRASIATLFVLGTGAALGAATTDSPAAAAAMDSPAVATPSAAPVVPEHLPGPSWSFAASAYAYFPGDDQDYVQPTIRADRGWLHLEARYNYEDLDTASAWFGYNFSAGDSLTFDFTAMVGGVFGDTDGYAPGYEFTLGWRKLELSSEGEYLFDTGDSSDDFFYTWSELTLAPTDWFRFGLVVQRTKVYQTDFDIQRGLLIGFTYKSLDMSAYAFNPDVDRPTYVLAASISF